MVWSSDLPYPEPPSRRLLKSALQREPALKKIGFRQQRRQQRQRIRMFSSEHV
jgi:hypothetical protein